jgi:hypothetical protein
MGTKKKQFIGYSVAPKNLDASIQDPALKNNK